MNGDSTAVAFQFDDAAQQRWASHLGMWVFLATEILFFGVLFTAYSISRILHPEAFAVASRLTNLTLGSLNTAILLTSSLTMALAVDAAARDGAKATRRWLLATMALGLVFLVIKAGEYYIDYTERLVPGLNFAYSGPYAGQVELFFYLYFTTTGVHALHLIIGISLIAVMAVMAARGRFSARYHTPLAVTGLYWHLIDVVWIFLYPALYLVSRP
jgi:cytochrome c oxidase subunit 3